MPTGYTAPLHDGEDITFQQFVLRCSRAMGAAIMQRDDALEDEIELRTVSSYELERVEKDSAALVEAIGRTGEEWAQLQTSVIADAIAYRAQHTAKRDGIAARYVAMLAEVQAWMPPTSDHEGLKQFMVEQLESSIKFDCGDWMPDVPAELPVDEYRERELGRLARSLERSTEQLEKERERVRDQNAWVLALRDSLSATSAAE